MNRQRILSLAKIVVAVGLIWWVIRQAGWENIRDTLAHIDVGLWAIGLGCMLFANVTSLLRWNMLMRSQGLNSTPWLAIRLGFIGIFFNNVLPGLTGGDLVKALYVTRENPKQRAAAVVSVIVDRVIGIIALALIAAVIIPFDLESYGEAAWGIYSFLGLALVGTVFALSRRAKGLLRALLGRFGRRRKEEPSMLGKIDQAVSMYRDHLPTVFLALGMSFVVHLVIIVTLSIFGTALADGGLMALSAEPTLPDLAATERREQLETLGSLTLTAYCSIVPIIMIISALPVAPAGWGVGEAAFAYFFGLAGVIKADAVALSLTYRVTAVLISLLGGVFLLFDRKRVLEAAHEEAALEADAPPSPD